MPAILPRNSMSPIHQSSYRPDIDGLRAIAVLSVIVFHAGSKKLPGGFIGVDIFFVISGYLISSIILTGLENGRFSFVDFYRRRIKRIFPALALVLATTWAVGWFALLNDEYRSLGKHIAASSLFISNFVLWSETGYFDTAAELKPLLHLWSLAIEEQFYLLWPLLLFAAWNHKFGIDKILISILGLSFASNVITTSTSESAAFFLPFSRFWELMLGGLLGRMEITARTRRGPLSILAVLMTPSAGSLLVSNAKAVMGLLMISTALFVYDRSFSYPGWAVLLPAIGSALLISSGMGAWVNRRLLASQGLVLIGLISYPLYLWHWSLMSLVRIIEWGKPTRGMINAAVVLAFILAWLTYVLIERPIRFGAYPERIRNTIIPISLAIVMALIGVVGFATFWMEGFPSRGPLTEIANPNEKLSQLKRVPAVDAACDNYVGKDRNFGYCRLNAASAAPTVAVIGDSHADAIFPGFADFFAAHRAGSVLMAAEGCPPWLNTTVYFKGETEKVSRCPAEVGRIFEIVLSSPNIRSVVLVSRGPLYISKAGFGTSEAGTRLHFGYGNDHDGNGLDQFARGLDDSIKALTAAGKSIYFLLQVPELGFDPEWCFGRRVHFSPVHTRCSVTRNEMEDRHAGYRTFARSFEKKYTNFHVVDPWPLLCDSTECKAIIENQLMYSDDDHLSSAGSQYLVSGLASVLSEAVLPANQPGSK